MMIICYKLKKMKIIITVIKKKVKEDKQKNAIIFQLHYSMLIIHVLVDP